MTRAARRLLTEALSLPEEERAELASLLIASIDGPPDADWDKAWAAEVERRVRAHERGEGELFDVEDVMAEAEKIAP